LLIPPLVENFIYYNKKLSGEKSAFLACNKLKQTRTFLIILGLIRMVIGSRIIEAV